MIKRTVSFVRPNLSVEFYQNDPDWESYKKEKYHKSKQVLGEEKQTSEDGLVLSLSWIYKDIDALEGFLSDPKNRENFLKRDRYNSQNKIRRIVKDDVL